MSEQRRARPDRTVLERERISRQRDVTLLELVDRLLDKGVVVSGDITLAVADVDLVYVGLRALLSSVETAQKLRSNPGGEGGAHRHGAAT